MICEDPLFAFNCSELPAFVEPLDDLRRRPGREAGADQVGVGVRNSLHAAFAVGNGDGSAVPVKQFIAVLWCC